MSAIQPIHVLLGLALCVAPLGTMGTLVGLVLLIHQARRPRPR